MSCAGSVGPAFLGALFGGGTGAFTGIKWGRKTLWTPIVTGFFGMLVGAAAAGGIGMLAPEAPCNDSGPPYEPDPPNLDRDVAIVTLLAIVGAALIGFLPRFLRLRWHPAWLVLLIGAPALAWAGIHFDTDHEVVVVGSYVSWLVVVAGLAMGPRERLKSAAPLDAAVSAEKGRYNDAAQRHLYPISTFNSWCARPISAVLAPILSPNQVSLLSLVVSLVGLALVWTADWLLMAIGAGAVHLGLLLDHADGQVARRTGKGSTWGMYLDMVIDRIVEVGLVIALIPALQQGATGGPTPLWTMSPGWVVPVALATVGTMLLWRFLTAYNDILYLRAHLMATHRMPHPSATPRGLTKRPLLPWVFNRDWLLLIWVVGVINGQAHLVLALLFLTTLLMCVERVIVFRSRHGTPEGDANRILGKDYH